jgi:CheY-like chemotaxis protein
VKYSDDDSDISWIEQARGLRRTLSERHPVSPSLDVDRDSLPPNRETQSATLVRSVRDLRHAPIDVTHSQPQSDSALRRDMPRVLATKYGDSGQLTASALRILVVDDNRDSAISLAILLGLVGHETTTAFDGEEGLETAQLFQPDVVLLDIGMPKLNGYEVCRALRALPRERRLVIVALTGWGQEEDRRKSVEAGFDAHLVKPVDPDALQRTLRQLMR